MANPTNTMKNKNDDRPFGNQPSGAGKPSETAHFAEKARDVADKAKETASNVADKARDLASNVSDRARDAASAMATSVGQKASDIACNVQQKAGEMASTAQQKAGDMACQVGHKVEDATAAVAGGMRTLSQSIREHSPDSGMLRTASASVADTLESGSRYIQEEGLSGMSNDLVNLVRRNPLPALFVGVAVGYLIARATTSSRS